MFVVIINFGRQSKNKMSFYGNPETIEDVPPMKYITGDFRSSFLEMHKVITKLGYWEFMKTEPPKSTGYLFWNVAWLKDIKKQCNTQHSGGSWIHCLHLCQYVATNGWDSFVRDMSFAVV